MARTRACIFSVVGFVFLGQNNWLVGRDKLTATQPTSSGRLQTVNESFVSTIVSFNVADCNADFVLIEKAEALKKKSEKESGQTHLICRVLLAELVS